MLEFDDGNWVGLEVKLGESDSVISAAENNLLRLRNSRMVPPSDFLAIITGGTSGYTRPSGVHVIPLSALGPIRD